MARPRTFDENDVIDRAMMQFWKEGYEGTSISDLETATGISRISLYNAFGDKDGLFIHALEKYRANAREYFLADDFAAGGLQSIEKLFSSISTKLPKDAPQQFGCLMLNTILDIDTVSEKARSIVNACRDEMIEGFAAALRVASERGEAKSDSGQIVDRAEFLVGSMWGARITARLKRDMTASRGVSNTVLSAVQAWRTH